MGFCNLRGNKVFISPFLSILFTSPSFALDFAARNFFKGGLCTCMFECVRESVCDSACLCLCTCASTS